MQVSSGQVLFAQFLGMNFVYWADVPTMNFVFRALGTQHPHSPTKTLKTQNHECWQTMKSKNNGTKLLA